MKHRTPEQLKGQVKSFAQKNNLQPQEVLQMFFLERVLERLSKSDYAASFILKGGLLISSMFGVNERTTMDMDTTVTGIDMDEEEIRAIIIDILSIEIEDGVEFEFEKLEPIREDDDYNNFRAFFVAKYGKIANAMKMDITTGDVITPGAVEYSYKTILDGDVISVKAYNKETIIAEKFETIIRRNIGTTRARDFYDLHMLYNLFRNEINKDVLKMAIDRTSMKRDSQSVILEWQEILEDMINDLTLQNLWNNYCKTNRYAFGISFETIMKTVEDVGKEYELWSER